MSGASPTERHKETLTRVVRIMTGSLLLARLALVSLFSHVQHPAKRPQPPAADAHRNPAGWSGDYSRFSDAGPNRPRSGSLPRNARSFRLPHSPAIPENLS